MYIYYIPFNDIVGLIWIIQVVSMKMNIEHSFSVKTNVLAFVERDVQWKLRLLNAQIGDQMLLLAFCDSFAEPHLMNFRFRFCIEWFDIQNCTRNVQIMRCSLSESLLRCQRNAYLENILQCTHEECFLANYIVTSKYWTTNTVNSQVILTYRKTFLQSILHKITELIN